MRKAKPPGGDRGAAKHLNSITAPALSTTDRHISQLDLAALQRVWWNQIKLGHRMPAQVGVILFLGGKP